MEDQSQEKKVKEQGRVAGPAFEIKIKDSDLADIIDKRASESEKYFKEDLKIEERRKKNNDFWKGKQLNEADFDDFQIPVVDNLIYQDLETRIAIISSKMPDIVVTPPNQTQDKRERARTLERALRVLLSNSVITRLIKNGLRKEHLDFTAAIKVRWNDDIDDIDIYLVDSKKLIMDHTATISDNGFTADNMEFTVEWLEEPVAKVVAKFPDKKEKIFEAMKFVQGTTKQINSKMRYQEVHFTFYGSDGELIEGTCWKYNKLILGKQRAPYWDWDGYEKEGLDTKKITAYRNFFERPRKPYIFFSYQNLGDSPIDSTTPVEQSIPLQKLVNKRKRQITEISDRAIPKLVFSGDAMTKEQARDVTNDPDEHVVLNGEEVDVRKAFTYVVAQAPDTTLLQELQLSMTQIDAKFATHSVTRGAVTSHESGISKQITKEGDLSSHDDMSRIVVERVIFELANWYVHMMKLFYEKEHFVKNVGKDGELVYVELKRDDIDDGIAVNVQSSSVDKQQRRFDAQTAAARRTIDPLSYWEAMDVPNPKEMTRRLITFLSGNMQAYAQITEISTDPLKDNGEELALTDIKRIEENEDFPVPTPSQKYLETMIKYTQSEEYTKQSDTIKARFKIFVQKLRDKFEEDVAKFKPAGVNAAAATPPAGAPAQPQNVPGQQPMGVPTPAPMTNPPATG